MTAPPRTGSFLAQHGAAEPGDSSNWTIIGGSGSGQLDGISGTAVLEVDADGDHRTTFDYELA